MIQISAVYLGIIKSHGVSVGTLCNLADYLMAFLHWRALLWPTSPAQTRRGGPLHRKTFA